jgi:hypothetical protein
MSKTYGVWERIKTIVEDKDAKDQKTAPAVSFNKSERVGLRGVARGLSWAEAKELKKINRQYEIFPE